MLSIKRNSRSFKLHLYSEIEVDRYFKDFPIVWNGFLNNSQIQVIQDEYGNNPKYFNFTIGFLECSKYQKDIIRLIDNELRRILD